MLPRIVPSSGVLGETAPGVLGAAPIPIAGVAGDQQAATFGQACFAPGMAKNTYGTGCFMLMNTGTVAVPSRNKLLTTVGWQGPPATTGPRTAYCLEGSVFKASATVQWLRDGLQMIQNASEIEALAASVADTGDVFLVPAFAGLGAPDWDGRARGTLVGLTGGTTRAHIARAALEAIALQSADLFGAMSRDSGIALTELRVDGGVLGQTYNGIHTGISIHLWENKNTVKLKKAQILFNDFELSAHTNEHFYHIKHIYQKYSNLKITLQEYQSVFSTLNNTALLNKALALGEITTIQYFMEINYYSQALSSYLQTEKDYHITISELYKYQL